MIKNTLPRAALAAVLLFAPAFAAGQVPVPPLAARVTDLTGTLSGEQRAAVEARLAELESRKGSQVAVLLVPTVQPETIEQYATRVFDQWKLGRKGVNDGVLLAIARNDRKLRIEVGYGLEGAIPDAYAKRIIEEDITPRFRQGDFFGGVSAGVDRIVKLVDGEAMPPPERPALSRDSDYPDLLFYGFVAVLVLGGVLRALFGRLLAAGIIGLAAGVVTFILYNVIAAVIIAILAFLITLANKFSSGGGSSWSSGGSSWSSGGGGFSGGGGSSGGGGASGSW
ncbi:MAG: hypothetical protein A3I02_01650 [Betaproteobacteria bacterium RIFCSPLOWO2_02_FULL_67_26]|nr:MAG: hypothetical protein A3I02_01650 [Betaproteobacteria bacterium RIFCSPLOWO2_02_FULL_67_26]